MKRRGPGTERAGVTVRYDSESERVVVSLPNRAEFRLPIEAFGSARRGTLEERASVRMSEGADGIRWDVFDVDYYWPYLMAVMLGPSTWQTSAKALGSMTSPAKAPHPGRTVPREGGRGSGGPPRKPSRA